MLRSLRWLGLALCCTLPILGSCKRASRAPDPFGEAVAAADKVWAARASTGSVDAAERAYTALLAQRPTAGAVLWRLSRVAWSRAMIEPARAAKWHEVGRELALRCVAAAEPVAEGLLVRGDRLGPPVVLDEAPAPCRVYAAAHVVGLVYMRGPGAALDLEDAAPLLAGLPEGVEPAVQGWTSARLRLLQGAEPAAAREAMRQAVAAEPGVRFYRAEAMLAFPDLDGSLPPLLDDPRWALENAAFPR